MVSVIINYCSNERCFLDAVLTESLKFSDDVIVSYGTHLYDGTPEDLVHINEYILKYPTVKFVSYDVDINLDLSKQNGVHYRPTAYWHNMARWTGACQIKEMNGWVFVIDADEIPEGTLVKEWLEAALPILKENECYKIANYWYFKDPTNRARTLEDSVLLIHSKHLTEYTIFGDFERDHLISVSDCILKRQIRGIGGSVLFHHYSWCRSRSSLQHKIANWAHANDIFKGVNAKAIVDYIYHDDNVNDIVHNYSYDKVENKFNIKM